MTTPPLKSNVGSVKRTVWIMFFAQMISMIGFSSIFPFLPLYVHALGTVTSLGEELCAGLVFSGQAFTMMIAAPIWGLLADRWGRKIMVERAMFGGAVVMTLMAFVGSAEELVALRMLQGLITGTISAANALVAAAAPRRQVGYAMGLMQAGMGLGLGLGPIIGGAVADTFGYRAAFYITGALLAVAGLVVWFGVQENFVAVLPTTSKRHFFLGRWRSMLAAPGVGLIYSLRFINQMGRILYIPILPLMVLALIQNPNQGNSFTGIVIGVSSAAAALFAVYFGRLGDRVGHRPILIYGFMGCALLFALQAFAGSGWQLFALQTLYGIALGGIVPAISALLAQQTPQGDEGAVYGLDSSITSGARVVGPMLGVAISVGIGMRAVFGVTALLYFAACLTAVLGLRKLPRTPAAEHEKSS
jgi:DHA1 family multidrug resistance protein-like MFS transporter